MQQLFFEMLQAWYALNVAVALMGFRKKETCDYAQKACLVCGKNAGGESNHNPNNDWQGNKEILAHGNKFLGC